MSFCTAINCMDGRVQLPVNTYLEDYFGAKFVDTVTEAGPAGILAREPDSPAAASIFSRVDISVEAHHSVGIAVIAHAQCAGNPVPDAQQAEEIIAAARLVQARYPVKEVLALWIDADWTVSRLDIE